MGIVWELGENKRILMGAFFYMALVNVFGKVSVNELRF
jgi:hypothetical protein